MIEIRRQPKHEDRQRHSENSCNVYSIMYPIAVCEWRQERVGAPRDGDEGAAAAAVRAATQVAGARAARHRSRSCSSYTIYMSYPTVESGSVRSDQRLANAPGFSPLKLGLRRCYFLTVVSDDLVVISKHGGKTNFNSKLLSGTLENFACQFSFRSE